VICSEKEELLNKHCPTEFKAMKEYWNYKELEDASSEDQPLVGSENEDNILPKQ
jgi:hypothetical protein